MLGLAIFKMPYEFYHILRVVVPASAIYLAYKEFETNKKLTFFIAGFWTFAVLFNPFYTVHFGPFIWKIFDAAGALFFLIYYLSSKNKS